MNKQEAIEKIKNLYSFVMEDGPFINKNQVIDLISKIDEPEKPVVPKFMAEWIGYKKAEGYTLYGTLMEAEANPIIKEWVFKSRQEVLARAWLDGYEIEKEKLYTVEIPNPNSNWKYTFLTKKDHRGVIIFKTDDDCWKKDKNNQLTESEIKKDFEWAWQWAKEVEDK